MISDLERLITLLDEDRINYTVEAKDNTLEIYHGGNAFKAQLCTSMGVEHLCLLVPVVSPDDALKMILSVEDIPMSEVTWKPVKLTRDGLRDPLGAVRKTYALSPEVKYPGLRHRLGFVRACYDVTPDHGPETMLFPCQSNGIITSYTELWSCGYNAVSDDSAITEFVKELNERIFQ